MLTVFGRKTSSNVQLVMWGAAELGLDVERLDYGHIHGRTDSPEFLAMNPNGLVPVLKDGELAMFESAAILRYLAARNGDGGAFWPNSPIERAPIDMWAEWGKTSFSNSFTVPIFWSRVRTAASERNEAALTNALGHFESLVDILEGQLGQHPYVCGDDLTLADIIIGHVLFRYFDIDIPRPDRPVLRAYYQRLRSRKAYQQHVMVSYDPLKAEGM